MSFLDQIRNRIVGGVRVFADTVRPSSVAGFLEGGKLMCREPGCPAPDTAARLLTDREVYHRVDFAADGFTIRHPLHERIGDALMSCPLHTYCAGLDTPPRIWLAPRVRTPRRCVDVRPRAVNADLIIGIALLILAPAVVFVAAAVTTVYLLAWLLAPRKPPERNPHHGRRHIP